MTNVYRRNYDPADFDPIDGPVPIWGNPGSLNAPPEGDTYHNRECRAHGVRWRGDDDCWLCEEGLEL